MAALLAGEGAGDLRSLPDGLDVADGASVVAATTIQDSYGRLGVLINNAAAYAEWTKTATAADLSQSRAVMPEAVAGLIRSGECLSFGAPEGPHSPG